MEWKYVGEAGIELKPRNSHSLGIVTVAGDSSSNSVSKSVSSGVSSSSSDATNYLVVYGGASPEDGPLGDTVYASLPADPASIGE